MYFMTLVPLESKGARFVFHGGVGSDSEFSTSPDFFSGAPGRYILAGTIDGRGEVTAPDTDVAVPQQRPKGAHVQAGDRSAVPAQHAERLHNITLLKQCA